MSRTIIYLGLDIHKDSITIALLPDGAPAPGRVERLPNDLAKSPKEAWPRVSDPAPRPGSGPRWTPKTGHTSTAEIRP
jgi:hypothetical protein